MDWTSDPRSVLISLQVSDGVLHIVAPRKRLYSTTIYLFVPWVVGTALLLFAVRMRSHSARRDDARIGGVYDRIERIRDERAKRRR